MQNYSGMVQRVMGEFLSTVVPTAREEEAKAQLTRRAAWQIHLENPNIGLLRKETGNNVAGLSVDIIMDRSDGSIADVASSTSVGQAPGMLRIVSVWVPQPPNIDPPWLARWVEPTEALARLPGPMTVADPEPQPEPEPEEPDEHEGGTVPMPDLIAIITSAITLSQEPIRAAMDGIAHELAEIRKTQDRGLGGTVIGYKVRLKP